ncbi:MAG: amidohydrolase family protein [Anaerolineales bacterium]|nr:amidohydrolase family protein [Anaerolineales bacterium]
MKTALVDGLIIDGSGGTPLSGSTVVIEGTKILEISRQREFGDGVQVIDISGKTIIPGLIDTHNHFAPWIQWLINFQDKSLAYMSCKTVYMLKATLESGVTTARDLGGMEAGYVEAQKKGLIPGPRLQAGLVIIGPTFGVSDDIPGLGKAFSMQGMYAVCPGVPMPWCDGPWDARKKVREVLRYGADAIKIGNTSTPYDTKLAADRRHFTREELDAIVDEAHEAGVQVLCHAMNSIHATKDAVFAGVDSIEHGTLLDGEIVDEMVRRGTWLVPMLSIGIWHSESNPNPKSREFNEVMLEKHRKSFQLALEAGVRIAMGSDAGFAVDQATKEVKYMVDFGMTPMQSIVASTRDAAECMRMQDLVGTLEPGKEADLLVLDGNPLDDIKVLTDKNKISMVMQAGKPAAGPMAYQFPWHAPDHDEKNANWIWY